MEYKEKQLFRLNTEDCNRKRKRENTVKNLIKKNQLMIGLAELPATQVNAIRVLSPSFIFPVHSTSFLILFFFIISPKD